MTRGFTTTIEPEPACRFSGCGSTIPDLSIEVHTICWNEERLLPLFLSHYSEFATRIVVWDNFSDDSSRELVRDCPIAEVHLYDSGGMSSNERYLDIKNHCWKGSASDWIVICDVDELIYHPDIKRHLQHADADILRCDGFNVTGPFLPARPDLATDTWRGRFSRKYSKPAVFRPTIGEIRYRPGCHLARPKHPITPSEVKLLHCHYLGTQDDLVARYRRVQARKCPEDIRRRLGHHYFQSDDQIRAEFRRVLEVAVPFRVIDSVRHMQRDKMTPDQIAAELDRQLIEPPQEGNRWTGSAVQERFGEL